MLDRLKARAVVRLRKPLAPFGVNIDTVYRNIGGRHLYRRNVELFEALRAQSEVERAQFPLGPAWPCYGDRFDDAGTARGHYFHQDLYVAQLIHAAAPERHVDIASRIDGFVAHVASYRAIEVLDIRPLASSASNITFRQHDVVLGDPAWDASCDSLSCLHAIEHFGLGRYGDTVDLGAWRQAWENMRSMVRPGGTIYLSTVIGPQRVEFDAHRVFAVPTLVDLVERSCEIVSLAYVDDAGDLHRGADPHGDGATDSFGCHYGCAIFELRR